MVRSKTRVFLLMCVMALTGAACAQRPSESEVEEILEEYYKSERFFSSATDLQVKNLEKTNGLAEMVDGARYYTMDFQVEIVFPEGWSYSDIWNNSIKCKPRQGYKETGGKIRIVKTENGWRLVESSHGHVVFNTCDVNHMECYTEDGKPRGLCTERNL